MDELEQRRARDNERSREYYRRHREAILAKRAERAAVANEAAKAAGTVGYKTAHDRVERQRGRADEYVCACCQQRDARDWACITPTVHPEGQDGYSPFVSAYQPVCRSCHWRLDHGQIVERWIKWRDAA
jgi:hypothetical protein